MKHSRLCLALVVSLVAWVALAAEHPTTKEETQVFGAPLGVLPTAMLSVEVDAETGHETQPPACPLG